jgi:hypothetical protein
MGIRSVKKSVPPSASSSAYVARRMSCSCCHPACAGRTELEIGMAVMFIGLGVR